MIQKIKLARNVQSNDTADKLYGAGYGREERYDDYGKKQFSDAHSLSPLNHIFFKRLWQI